MLLIMAIVLNTGFLMGVYFHFFIMPDVLAQQEEETTGAVS